MTQITEHPVPELFLESEIDTKELWETGRTTVAHKYGNVSVALSVSSRNGTFLAFDGLVLGDGHLCLSVDGDKINEVAHLILSGNKAIGEGK